MEAQQHDIQYERQLVEEENEIVESEGLREHSQKRSLSVALILIVIALAIGFFIAITYMPGQN